MPAPIVVFDLDGTLVDTAPDLVDTLNVVIEPEGLSPVAYEDTRHLVGGGARLMIERAYKAQSRTCDSATLERLFQTYIAHYAANVSAKSRPFPGAEAAMDELERNGFLLAICTNKLEHLARHLLNQLDMTRRFAFICGQDTFGIAKPDPTPLLRTIAAAGGEADMAVMVGDSVADIGAARAALVPVVAVEFGYADRPVPELGADRIIGTFEALPEVVRDLVRRT
jgi:phosphoglycolate phosphatase